MDARRALLPGDCFTDPRDSLSISQAIVQQDEIKLNSPMLIKTPTPDVTRMSLSEMDSLISPFIRRRADEFTQQEIDLLIEEIGKLRHILLSKLPQHLRLKKNAWEDVASNLALRFPNGPKRSGIQLKKKWENVVLRTRRKLRDGLLTQEMERNECFRKVVQYLVEANQSKLQVEEPQASATGTSEQLPMDDPTFFPLSGVEAAANLTNIQESVNPITNGNNIGNPLVSIQNLPIKREENATVPPSTSAASNAEIRTAINSTDVSSEEESADNSSESEENAMADFLANANGCPGCSNATDESHLTRRRKGKILSKELLRQSRAEHEIRMKILDVKHRYWQMKFDSLRRKVANDDQNN